MKFPPYSIWYVGTALKKAGYDARLFHISPEQINQTIEKIKEINPLWVGFSTFTADSLRENAEMSRKVKKLGLPTFWGGIHPSLCPDQCLHEDYVDYVCIGEGEETAIDFTRMLLSEIKPEEVMGISWQEGDQVILNKARPVIKDLDQYWFDWDLLDITQYFRPYWGDRQRVFHIITSRGCPFKCGFCYIASSTDYRKWRGHSKEIVINQIKEFKEKYGIDGVFFQDDNFAVRRKRALEIVDEIDMPSFFEIRADNIDEEFAEKLSKTKTREIFMGLESGSDRILQLVQKDATVADMKNAVQVMSNYPDIMLSISIIYAYPGETYKEFLQTCAFVNEMLKLKPNMSITGGFFIPYPGTPLYQKCIDMGWKPFEKTEEWDTLDRWGNVDEEFDLSWSDWMSVQQAVKIRRLLQIASFAYKFNVPFLKKLCARKLCQADVDSNLMINLMSSFRSFYNRKLYRFKFMRSIKHILAMMGNRAATRSLEK